MAAKKIKRTSPKIVKSQSMEVENYSTKNECESSSPDCCCGQKKNILKIHLIFLLIVVAALGVFGYFFRDKILAATVNGKPLFRYYLNQKLFSSFGKETLENLIVESLVRDEIKKNQVVVSEQDIDAESEKISKTLSGGMKLEDALKLQGMTLAEFRNQLKMRLGITSLLKKEISVTEEEIDTFIKDNASALTATVAAEKRTEAKKIIEEQKISEKIQTWVSELLKNAKITRFLK